MKFDMLGNLNRKYGHWGFLIDQLTRNERRGRCAGAIKSFRNRIGFASTFTRCWKRIWNTTCLLTGVSWLRNGCALGVWFSNLGLQLIMFQNWNNNPRESVKEPTVSRFSICGSSWQTPEIETKSWKNLEHRTHQVLLRTDSTCFVSTGQKKKRASGVGYSFFCVDEEPNDTPMWTKRIHRTRHCCVWKSHLQNDRWFHLIRRSDCTFCFSRCYKYASSWCFAVELLGS